MRFARTHLAAIAFDLPPLVVSSDDIEARLSPAYRALGFQPGQLYALTGIRERRWWPPGMTMAQGAATAAQRALQRAGVPAGEIGMLIYAGVCRDHLEPATACAAADALGVRGDAQVYDVSNACLGQLNGLLQIAGAIESRQIRAGLVCSCESSRQIMNLTMDRLNAEPTMQAFKLSLATLTGGSGAAAMLLVDESLAASLAAGARPHRLLGGVVRTNPRWHRLCRWGPDTGVPSSAPMVMQTDAPMVLEHGVALGVETFEAFVAELGWVGEGTEARRHEGMKEGTEARRHEGMKGSAECGDAFVASSLRRSVASSRGPDKVVCHQVGAGHRAAALAAMGLSVEQDFSTFEYLGNIGTVSLPLTAAIADEQGFLQPGDRVGMLGIGSGLNCLMIGLNW